MFLTAAQAVLSTSEAFDNLALYLVIVWVLIISLVMMRGVFDRSIAYFGLVVPVLLIAVTVTHVGPLAVLAEVALGIWSLGVGLKLFKLSKAGGAAS